MKKEYTITQTLETGKWVITYYFNDVEEIKEQWSYPDLVPLTEIKQGYTLKE